MRDIPITITVEEWRLIMNTLHLYKQQIYGRGATDTLEKKLRKALEDN